MSLDLFVNGEISFEEIQGCIKGGISIQGAISSILNVKPCSKELQELYEKLCYAEVLNYMKYYKHSKLYAIFCLRKANPFHTN